MTGRRISNANAGASRPYVGDFPDRNVDDDEVMTTHFADPRHHTVNDDGLMGDPNADAMHMLRMDDRIQPPARVVALGGRMPQRRQQQAPDAESEEEEAEEDGSGLRGDGSGS